MSPEGDGGGGAPPIIGGGGNGDGGSSGGGDGGDGFVCDNFERAAVVPHPLWASTTGDPAPKMASGIVTFSASSSATNGGVMVSGARTRDDTVEIKANVFISDNADFSTHNGRIRLVEVDGSLAGGNEGASVYFDDRWHIEWHDFAANTLKGEKNSTLPVIKNDFFLLSFTVRFAVSGGFVRLAINGTTVLERQNLVMIGGVARSTWQATIGIPSTGGSTPALGVGVDNVCFRP